MKLNEITDFSSFVFDFIYLSRKVFSFIPDEPQFKCGMNSYREIESERLFTKLSGSEDTDKLFTRFPPAYDIEFYR